MTDHNKENKDKEIVTEIEEIQPIEEQTQESTDDTQTNESFTTSEERSVYQSEKWYHFNKKNLIILGVALFVGLGSGVAVGAEITEKEEHHHKITAMSKRLHEYEHESEHDKEHDKKEAKKSYKHQQSEQENTHLQKKEKNKIQQESGNLKKEEGHMNKEKNQDTEKEVDTVSSATKKLK